jgi:hypothetical protein
MPRYFFHVKRGQLTVLDQEGCRASRYRRSSSRSARTRATNRGLRNSESHSSERGTIVIDDELHTLLEVPFEDMYRAPPG